MCWCMVYCHWYMILSWNMVNYWNIYLKTQSCIEGHQTHFLIWPPLMVVWSRSCEMLQKVSIQQLMVGIYNFCHNSFISFVSAVGLKLSLKWNTTELGRAWFLIELVYFNVEGFPSEWWKPVNYQIFFLMMLSYEEAP